MSPPPCSRSRLSSFASLSIRPLISDGFTAFDRAWRYTYVNPAAARMLGRRSEELLGKVLWEEWPGSADTSLGVAYQRAVAENIPVQVEGYHPEPLNRWFEVRCYPSPDGPSLFFIDSTDRRNAQRQMRLLESSILQTTDGIVIARAPGEDAHTQILFLNSAFERMTGFSLADLQAGSHQIIHDGGQDRLVRRKDGTEFWATINFNPFTEPDGQGLGVWSYRDVTERKRPRMP
jgi:PAS domain S-box-containing protein